MTKRRTFSFRRLRSPSPPLTPETTPGRFLWLDAAAGVEARGAASFASAAAQYLRSTSTAFSFEYNQPFSASVWFKLAATGAITSLMGRMLSGGTFRGWLCWINNANLQVILRNDNATGRMILVGAGWAPDTNWHHAAFTYNGSGLASGVRIYLDGVLQSATVNTDNLGGQTIVPTGTNFNLGSRDAGNSTFNGLLDEPAVWSGRVLTAADVAAIRNGGAGLPGGGWAAAGLDAALLDHWELDEAADGATAVNRAGRLGAYPLTAMGTGTYPAAADGSVAGPAGDGDTVRTWTDRLAAVPFTQATAARRPVFRAAPSRLVLDGADDRLTGGSTTLGPRATGTLFLAFAAGPGASRTLWDEAGSGGGSLRIATDAASRPVLTYTPPGGATATVAGSSPVGPNSVLVIRRGGGTADLFLDGLPVGSGPIGPGTLATLGATTLGADAGGAAPTAGAIRHAFATGDALTAGQVAELSTWFAGH